MQYCMQEVVLEITPKFEDKSVNVLQFPSDNNFNLVISRDSLGDFEDTKHYATAQHEIFRKNIPSFNLNSASVFTHPDTTFYFIDYSWKNDGKLVAQNQYYAELNEGVLIFTFTADEKFEEEQKALIKNIIASFSSRNKGV